MNNVLTLADVAVFIRDKTDDAHLYDEAGEEYYIESVTGDAGDNAALVYLTIDGVRYVVTIERG